MDDALGVRASHAVGIDVRHDVVADLLFLGGDDVVINIVHVRAELLDLFAGDGQAQLHLGLGQRDPKPAPGAVARVVGKEFQHRRGGVSSLQRALIRRIRVGHIRSPPAGNAPAVCIRSFVFLQSTSFIIPPNKRLVKGTFG